MDDNDLSAKIDSLQSELRNIASVQSLRSDLHSEVKEHKEFLESLMNKAVRVMSLIAAFLIGVTAVLGVKTYWDVEQRLTDGASAQVEKYLTRDFVTREFEELFERKFQVVSILELITRLETLTQADYDDEPISDTDVEQAIQYIEQDESEYLSRLLSVLAQNDSPIAEYREAIGAAITSRLTRAFDGSSTNNDSRSTQETLIRAIANLRHRGAYDLLRNHYESGNIPVGTKVVLINALPRIVERGQERVLASSLLEDIEILKDPLSPLYAAQLAAAYRLNAASAAQELRDLIQSDDYNDAEIAVRIILGSEMTDSSSKLLALFLSSPYAYVSYRDDPMVGLRRLQMRPSAGLMVQSGDQSWTGVGSISELNESRHFATAIGKAFEIVQSDPERLQYFLERVAAPMAEYGAAQLQFEIKRGLLGPHADPTQWQDSLTIRSTESSGILLSVGSGEVSLMVKENGITRTEAIPLTSITSVVWVRRSVTNRRGDPF